MKDTRIRDRTEYYKNNKDKFKASGDSRYQKYRTQILKRQREKYYDDANYPKYILWRAKRRARNKGLEFNIDVSDIIIPEKCPILGLEIKRCKGGGKKSNSNSPSIDRIDPSRGYIKGNVQIISNLANVMKSNATVEQLLTFAKYIINKYEFQEV